MSAKEPIIYLDLDGVCTNLIGAAIELHGENPREILNKWEEEFPGEFNAYKVMGMEKDEFWEIIHDNGVGFWARLDEYPWFKELYRELSKIADVFFLSAPTYSGASLAGKLKWLQDRFNKEFQDYVFTSHKYHLAHPNSILIDDYDRNVDLFREQGGSGILFPQFWNDNYHIKNKLEYTLNKVKKWHKNL
mgnify:CR=1 FL=1